MKEKQEVVNTKNSWRVFKIALSLFVLALALFVVMRVYLSNPEDKLTRETAQALHLPIAFVNTSPVSFTKYYARADLAKDLTGEALTKEQYNDIREQLIDDLVAKKLLAKMNASVTKEEFDKYYEILGKITFTDAYQKYALALSELELKDLVVLPELVNSKLQTEYASDRQANAQAYTQADMIMSKLEKGEDFDTLAAAYSKDEQTATIGGDLGMVGFNDIVPEIYFKLENLPIKEPRLIISRFGLHIVLINSTDNNGIDGSKRYNLKQIFIPSGDYEKWFRDQKAEYNILRLK